MAEIIDFMPALMRRLASHRLEEPGLDAGFMAILERENSKQVARYEQSLLDLAEAEDHLISALFRLEAIHERSSSALMLEATIKSALKTIEYGLCLVDSFGDHCSAGNDQDESRLDDQEHDDQELALSMSDMPHVR